MNKILSVLIFILMLMPSTIEASPTKVIKFDAGGGVREYLNSLSLLKLYNVLVVVDGPCMSACTIYLDLYKTDKICSTPRGEFWFHSAYVEKMPLIARAHTTNGVSAVYQDMADKAMIIITNKKMMAKYPKKATSMIESSGGLTKEWIRIRGTDIVKSCG